MMAVKAGFIAVKTVLLLLAIGQNVVFSRLQNTNFAGRIGKTGLNCGYLQCNPWKEGAINVHIVPYYRHKHLGDSLSFSDYFSTEHTNIIESYVAELNKNPARRFSESEIALFERRYRYANNYTKLTIGNLVEQGRLEFITGSLTASDEATANYLDLIDSIAMGHRYLAQEFGPCSVPKTAWQQEQKGHTSTQASIFANSGFEGIFISNLNKHDYNMRYFNKTLEMLWETTPPIGKKANIFTSTIFGNNLGAPGFCFDLTICNNSILDDGKYSRLDHKKRVESFLEWVTFQQKGYKTQHILVPMVADFKQQPANVWFKNIDNFIKSTNSANVSVLYSTPSCYLKALNDAKITWPKKIGDFLPYSDDAGNFLAGMYTSNSRLRKLQREISTAVQAGKQWLALLPETRPMANHIDFIREAAMLSLQHKLLTGSSVLPAVSDGIAQILDKAGLVALDAFKFAANSALGKPGEKLGDDFKFCPPSGHGGCQFTESITEGNFVITLYNPSPKPQSFLVTFPAPYNDNYPPSYLVTSFDGSYLAVDVFPISKAVLQNPARNSTSTYEVHFMASDLSPMSFTSYHVTAIPYDERMPSKYEVNVTKAVGTSNETDVIFENKFYVMTLDGAVGTLKSLARKDNAKIAINFRQDFLSYQHLNKSLPKNGFRPDSPIPNLLTDHNEITYILGDVLTEIRVRFGNRATQIIRMLRDSQVIEGHWILGPQPISGDIVTRFTTDIRSRSQFYTDTNGILSQRRVRTSQFSNYVAENVYPATSWAYIKDEVVSDPRNSRQLTVVTDRTQGATSLRDGELEFMIDWANDPPHQERQQQVATGIHRIMLTSAAEAEPLYKTEAITTSRVPFLGYTATTTPSAEWLTGRKNKAFLLRNTFPENIVLASVEPWGKQQVLVRLQHIFNTTKSDISLRELINPVPRKFEETQLTGIVGPATGKKNLFWQAENGTRPIFQSQDDANLGTISLRPGEIRTFIFTL